MTSAQVSAPEGKEQGSGPARRNGSHGRRGRLTLSALGVVFGDISTSPCTR